MPNAGIHGTRSRNWNSALLDMSKPAQSTSVAAKVASEVPSAMLRTSASRDPSRLPIKSRRIAPTTGSQITIDNSGTPVNTISRCNRRGLPPRPQRLTPRTL